MGSKNRIAKYILPIMLEQAKIQNINTWVEPMVGGANMIDKVPISFKRIGFDLNPHVIFSMKDIRDNIENLPDFVTEEHYNSLKKTPPSKITSYIRFTCSFGSKFEDSYAKRKGSNEFTYAGAAKRNALKQSPNIQGVEFICDTFENIDVENSVIYCDPPYKGTTSYKTNPFPYDVFYDWCIKMKDKGNVVFVSEYSMPDEFEEVWRGEIKTNFASSRTKATHNATEKLFICNPKKTDTFNENLDF